MNARTLATRLIDAWTAECRKPGAHTFEDVAVPMLEEWLRGCVLGDAPAAGESPAPSRKPIAPEPGRGAFHTHFCDDGTYGWVEDLTCKPFPSIPPALGDVAASAQNALESLKQENAALREALTRAMDWMDDDRIGQITYMEGGKFYRDLHQHKCVARAVLARFPAPPDGGEGG